MKKIFLIAGALLVAAVIGVIALRFILAPQPTALLPTAPEHGTSFLLEADGANTNAALKAALQGRFSALGLAVFWEAVSPTQIRILTPTVTNGDTQSALEYMVGGQLEFRLVHTDSQSLTAGGMSQPGYEILKQNGEISDGSAPVIFYLVKKMPELTGKYIQHAMAGGDSVGSPSIEFTLTPEGARIFAKVTRENIGQQLAIVVDGKLISAPRIVSEIGANGVISGRFTDDEAAALAVALNHPLPVPVKLLEMKKF